MSRSIDYWRARLAEGASLVVPEQRVMDAQRALLIQNLGLTWRYSVGNPYQQFSFPEGVDVAQVMAARGFAAVARSILVTSLSRRPTPYPNWKIGQKLVGSATYYRFTRDRSYIRQVTPVLRGYVTQLGRQLDASGRGLLQRERYSSDIADSVYGLHSQAVAWQGLRSMGDVWSETGDVALATRCRELAAKLGAGLTAAVRESQTWLPDGSLFIPVKLLDGERPYGSVTESRSGSYWNLVAPYAFASGLFSPGSVEAEGALRYLFSHGSRFLGLVRAGAYALYGRAEPFPTSGTDQVYGLNVSRFLADNDRPEQLVLSLYGQLAAGMTPGTFIAGEAASIAPLTGEYHRSMYLPPNGAANATFLETLRLLLVHETTDSRGRPVGLELAHATPRGWLAPGKRIAVRATPTTFGPLSYTIRSAERALHVSIDVPPEHVVDVLEPAAPAAARVTPHEHPARRSTGPNLRPPNRNHRVTDSTRSHRACCPGRARRPGAWVERQLTDPSNPLSRMRRRCSPPSLARACCSSPGPPPVRCSSIRGRRSHSCAGLHSPGSRFATPAGSTSAIAGSSQA